MANDCILWQGSRTGGRTRDYGQTNKGKLAHRIAYEQHFGAISSGMHVLHTCDMPLCVNPKHLYLGTAQDNARDKALRERGNKKLTKEQVHEIRASLESRNKLADKYAVSATLVTQIRNGTRRQFV
jgi:HNH endonuclease